MAFSRAKDWFQGLGAANSILVVAGVMLVILGACWRLALAPALKVVAGDFDNFYSYEGKLRVWETPGHLSEEVMNMKAVPIFSEMPVIIEHRQFNRFELTTSSVSVVEEELRILDGNTRRKIAGRRTVFKVDRQTGKLHGTGKRPTKKNEYRIVFPFDCPRKSVRYRLDIGDGCVNLGFLGERKVRGLTLYRFGTGKRPSRVYPSWKNEDHVTFVKQIAYLLPDAAEKEWILSGKVFRGEKVVNSHSVELSTRIHLQYETGILVEPRMGTVAGIKNVKERYSLESAYTAPGIGGGINLPLFELEYSMRKNSLEDAVNFARDELSKLNLQFVYIPLGISLLGLLTLTTGVLAREKRGSAASEKE